MDSSLTAHIISSLPWFLVRAFGLISAGLLVILIVFGIGMITGFTFRVWEPVKAWAIHKTIGIAFALSVIGHVLFLLIDRYQHYSLKMILVPFTGSTWITLGVLAMYLLAVIVISSFTIIDRSKSLWKSIHLLSYVSVGFVFFHALNTGTDLKHGWLRDLWIIFGIIIIIGILMRLWRAGTVKRDKVSQL